MLSNNITNHRREYERTKKGNWSKYDFRPLFIHFSLSIIFRKGAMNSRNLEKVREYAMSKMRHERKS